jgi:MFS family permease
MRSSIRLICVRRSPKYDWNNIISRRRIVDSINNRIVGKKSFRRDEIFKILELNNFTDEEIIRSYHRLCIASSSELSLPSKQTSVRTDVAFNDVQDGIHEENTSLSNVNFNLTAGVEKLAQDNIGRNDKELIDDLVTKLTKQSTITTKSDPSKTISLSFEEYKKNTISIAEPLDIRLWPIATSFLFTGLSIGIIIPCMPILVHMLEIPAAEYGFVVGSFGLSKLIGNLPAGYFVDTYGRKPAMVMGLGFCAIGVGGIGLCLFPGFGTPWLFFCRLMTGFGVSAFTGGSFMYISDISTPVNRTRTFAPAMAAFQAGTALGPAIGGLLVHAVGMGPTYAIVGASFASLTMINHILLPETLDKSSIEYKAKLEELKPDHGIYSIFRDTLSSWKTLMKNPRIRDIVLLNGAYWVTIAGAQMTLLPLLMVGPLLNLGATEIGGSFAMMSVVSVLSSYRIASLADRIGKIELTVAGAVFVSGSVAAIPFATTFPELLIILAPLALGSTAISSIPQAHISDLTMPHQRSNAMALLRAGGDLGLLLGASLTGIVADMSSLGSTMELSACIMFVSLSIFAIRSRELLHIWKSKPPVVKKCQ